MRSLFGRVVLIALAAAIPSIAFADEWTGTPTVGAFQPQVPISALARPLSWLDPSRFHFSTSVSVGSGNGGTSGLQVTSMSYQFRAPMWLNVSMGNAWGAGTAAHSGSPFLEGVDFGFRPLSNMLVRVQYHDFRSQLQYPYQPWGDPAGLWSH